MTNEQERNDDENLDAAGRAREDGEVASGEMNKAEHSKQQADDANDSTDSQDLQTTDEDAV